MVWEATLKIKNLSTYRDIKKLKKLLEDLENINTILTLTTKGIEPYKNYLPVKSILNALHDNHPVIHIFINKYQKLLKEKEKNK